MASRLLLIIKDYFPHGTLISDEAWYGRHHFLLSLLWVHVFIVPVFAWWMGGSVAHWVAMGARSLSE